MVNETDTEWRELFYQETDPLTRSHMLQEKGNARMQELFRKRHPRKVNPQAEDVYLQVFFELIRFSKDGRSRQTSTAASLRQLKALLERFGFNTRELADQEKDPEIYWELRNALRRFLEVTDKESYGRRFMGMIRLKKEEQLQHACIEVWHILHGMELLTRNVALDELRQPAEVVTKAIQDEYNAHDEGASARMHHVMLAMKARS